VIDWTPTLGDKILMKLFRYEVISETNCEDWQRTGSEDSGDAYLVRYFIFKRDSKTTKRPHLFIHHILKSDPDREHHDHPWDFFSLILKTGYWEETPDTSTFVSGGKTRKWYRPGSFLRRPAEWTHRLFLEKPAWTLVYTRKKRRDWGFHGANGWIFWERFIEHKCSKPQGSRDSVDTPSS
jgi:hypothetical protein